MYFSPVGFAVGYAMAQRNNLSQANAASVGLAGGVAGSTPIGLVLALALAQRLTPPPPPAPPPLPPPGVPAQVLAAPLAVQVPAAIPQAMTAEMAAVLQQFGLAGEGGPLQAPRNVVVRGLAAGNRHLVRVEWEEVEGARHYLVRHYRREAEHHPWHDRPEHAWFVDDVTSWEFVLPADIHPQHARDHLGFSVAAARTPFLLGEESGKHAPVF